MKVAAIGIGSNSVRLLIAEPIEGRLSCLERSQAVTRLASYPTAGGRLLLDEESIGKTWATASSFGRRAIERGATLMGVVATEAVRAAANRDILAGALERELQVPVTVVSGEEEAALGWRAVALDYGAAALLGVIDIGGASTELSVGTAGANKPQTVESLQVGSRTLMHRFQLDKTLTRREIKHVVDTMRGEFGQNVAEMRPTPQTAVVIGGTADVLLQLPGLPGKPLETESGAGTLFERAWLARWLDGVSALDQDGRVALGVPADRADVIVAGGAILLAILHTSGLDRFDISLRNILDGFLAQRLSGR